MPQDSVQMDRAKTLLRRALTLPSLWEIRDEPGDCREPDYGYTELRFKKKGKQNESPVSMRISSNVVGTDTMVYIDGMALECLGALGLVKETNNLLKEMADAEKAKETSKGLDKLDRALDKLDRTITNRR